MSDVSLGRTCIDPRIHNFQQRFTKWEGKVVVQFEIGPAPQGRLFGCRVMEFEGTFHLQFSDVSRLYLTWITVSRAGVLIRDPDTC